MKYKSVQMKNYRQEERTRKGIVNICNFNIILEMGRKNINNEQKFKMIKVHTFKRSEF